ncbi:MAG TPA: hypothetical protein VM580_08755 [Labilithrix sp.]|nr:hypothetical protein [Labilithrix sp.]
MSTESDPMEVRQAPDELASRRITMVTIASIVITALALVLAWVLLARWGQAPRRGTPPVAPRTIGILEQSLIGVTARGESLREEQAASLTRWGWVDRDAGIARIPIDNAIDALVASPPPSDRPLEEATR